MRQLLEEPYRFDFFQAVRILAWLHRDREPGARGALDHAVGGDLEPRRESVRFRAVESQSFPASAVREVRPAADERGGDAEISPVEMVVSFMGLTGPSGVLPQHYTRLLIERLRDKDEALRDFFDLFNHRLVSLFFRAWEKYRFPIGYERARSAAAGEDAFTQSLFSLVGCGMSSLRKRLLVDDEALLYYGGLFADHHRSAVSLEAMLADYFHDVDVVVLQFQGQWFSISEEDRSLLPSRELPDGQNCELGRTVVVGERTWDVQSKFRVRLGPLGFSMFLRFIPAGDALRPLCQLTRMYVGPEFDFDVELVLKASEVPLSCLGGSDANQPHLGSTTWLLSRPLEPDARDEEVVFALPDV